MWTKDLCAFYILSEIRSYLVQFLSTFFPPWAHGWSLDFIRVAYNCDVCVSWNTRIWEKPENTPLHLYISSLYRIIPLALPCKLFIYLLLSFQFIFGTFRHTRNFFNEMTRVYFSFFSTCLLFKKKTKERRKKCQGIILNFIWFTPVLPPTSTSFPVLCITLPGSPVDHTLLLYATFNITLQWDGTTYMKVKFGEDIHVTRAAHRCRSIYGA